jgi:hypothetical protein
MLTSSRFAPPRTWSRATSRALSYWSASMSFRKRAEPVTLVRSPIIWKFESPRIGSVSRPEKKVVRARGSASGAGSGRGRTLATDSAIARMWAGVVPQQPPTMLTRPLVANSPTSASRRRGGLVVLAEGVGQAGVRVARDAAGRDAGELGDVGAHLDGAERAVDADRERIRVGDRAPEGVDRLARERARGGVGDRDGDHDGQAEATRLEDLVDRDEGGLRVQRVEDRLDEQEVDVAVDEGLDLLAIGGAELVEGDAAGGRIVDVGGDRERLRRRAEGAGDEARLRRILRGPGVGGFPRDPGRGEVQLADGRLEAVIGLGDGVRAEGVRLGDVRAGLEIEVVDLADHVGAVQAEELVVALQVAGVVLEELTPEIGLGQPVALDHRAHRPVEDEDPLGEQAFEGREALGAGRTGRHEGSMLGGRAYHPYIWISRYSIRSG